MHRVMVPPEQGPTTTAYAVSERARGLTCCWCFGTVLHALCNSAEAVLNVVYCLKQNAALV
jgi:hypothetical protein